jgi:hypothetical protein
MAARTPDLTAGATGNGKTAQSYIAGIGASGALLAGAVVTFVFLVGTVSFEVWPEAAELDNGTHSLGVAELSGPAPSGTPSSATLGETVSLIAASVPSVDVPAAPKADSGVTGGGSDGSSGDTGTGGGDTGGGTGTAGGEPGGSGGGDGSNGPSDRPTNHRPDTGSSGSTGSGTAATPPSTGGNGESDRPSSGDRGRG